MLRAPVVENFSLIVGLGNPGGDYEKTRHNAGFRVVEQLATRWRAAWSSGKKFNARVAKAAVGDRRVVLAKPQTYMNASGEAVAALSGFYRVGPGRLLVIVDDADLPLGQVRMRERGSSGGHHGLQSVERHLGTREYARLRVGIGRRSEAREITAHVLGRFDSTEAVVVDKVLILAADQAETWLVAGVTKAMNQFNGISVNPAPVDERKDK